MDEEFQFVEQPPSVADYIRLRKAAGWAEVDRQTAEHGLKNALYSVCVVHEGEVIGCGRVVGDGAIYFYVQDIMVLPEFQGRNLGRLIMENVMGYIAQHARRNSFIGLFAAKRVASYYEQWGFTKRPPERPGMAMLWNS